MPNHDIQGLQPRPANRLSRTAKLLSSMFLFPLGGCGALRLGFLNPHGPVASGERHLFWVVTAVMLFVIGPVLLLTPIIGWHYRQSNSNSAFRPQWTLSWPLEFFIWVPPSLIAVGLAIVLWRQSQQFDPYTPIRSTLPPLEVQVVALDWRWLFIYPQQGITTIDELAIPAGRPVHLSLTSATVMQSMLVPQLAGQIYCMAGMTTHLNFAADQPGTFVGRNVQFNGPGFQEQRFSVVAVAPAKYQRWTATVKASAQDLNVERFEGLFKPTSGGHPILFSTLPPESFEQIQARSIAAPRRGSPM